MWPELQDDHLENSRKVPLDRHDIIIDKVAASHDNNHIVAVTSNNMVCIWKRVKPEGDSGGGGHSDSIWAARTLKRLWNDLQKTYC